MELQQVVDNNEIIKKLKESFDKRIDYEIIESVAYETNYNIEQATSCLWEMLANIPSSTEVSILLDEACSVSQPTETPMETVLIDLSGDDVKSSFEKHLEQLINDIKRGIKILVILRGVPGCGKSFLAEKIVKESYGVCQSKNFIFSADDYFFKRGRYEYNPQGISEAHRWNQNRARAALKDGVSPIIIDNTNTEAWEMKPYLAWAVEEAYDIEILEPNTPWVFNEKELARRNIHGVPRQKISDMLLRYEKGLTVEHLFGRFEFSYKNKLPPQPRNYPPLIKNDPAPKKATIEDLFGTYNAGCNGAQPLIPKKFVESSKLSNLKSWNVTSDDLKSWDVVLKPETAMTSPQSFPQITKPAVTIISTNNASTMTQFADLTEPKGGKIINANPNFFNFKPLPLNYPKEGCLDNSTMTEDFPPQEQTLRLLIELFPNIPEEYVREIYEKCQMDAEWATEILLNDKKELIPNYQPKVVEHVESEPPIKKFIEEIPKQTITQEQKDQIKHAIESSVTINKEHYSAHILKLKKLDLNEASTSRVDLQTEAGTVIAVDSDSELDSSEESDDSDMNDWMELYIGNDLVGQLQKSFGDPSLEFPQGFQPVIEIPKTLARQIYALYLESVFKQMDAQNLVLRTMIEEDEEFAKKLQEEECFANTPQEVPNLKKIMSEQYEQNRRQKIIDEWKNLTPDDIAYKLKKQKLISVFPSVEEETLVLILAAYNNNYQDTLEAVVASGVSMIEEATCAKEEPISQQILEDMKEDHRYSTEDQEENLVDQSPDALRKEAVQHQKIRETLLAKAQHYYSRRMYEVAIFYSGLARDQTRQWEKFNALAAEQTLRVNFNRLQNFDTLDLHHLRVKEALNALDIFLDRNIMLLRDESEKNFNYLMVITGRGNNSIGRIPKIKPAVRNRLKARNIKVSQVNPGLIRLKIFKNSLMTDQSA